MCKYKWVADSADTHVGTHAHTNPHLCKSEFRHTFCVTHKHKQARTHPIRAAAKIGIILTQSKCAQIASLFSLSFLSLALCHSLTLSLSHSVSRPGSWQQASRQHFSRRGFPSAHTQKTTQWGPLIGRQQSSNPLSIWAPWRRWRGRARQTRRERGKRRASLYHHPHHHHLLLLHFLHHLLPPSSVRLFA